jgi:hypothetical protein
MSLGFADLRGVNAGRFALYHYLSWLQEEIVDALASGLTEPNEPDP